MKVLVIGAAGMIGRKFCERLVKSPTIGGRDVRELIMADVLVPRTLAAAPFEVRTVACDLAQPDVAESLVADAPEVIYHLAAIVSGEAEADFDKGYRVNLDGTHRLFEAVRHAGYRPRIVLASSIAVFGAPFPNIIGEDYTIGPLTSYGTQKAIGELLLADFSRRGFFDGIALRLPTICVRPGKPNKAASGFFSSIIREPLKGEEAVLPVTEDVRHWFASPRAAVNFLFHAGGMSTARLGSRRSLNLPGVSATVHEMIAALERLAGPDCTKLIRREPDPELQRIVEGWPQRLDASRAQGLGFQAETDFEQIIHAHIEDECR
jgi:D-erythronate 2-dehydrogenase